MVDKQNEKELVKMKTSKKKQFEFIEWNDRSFSRTIYHEVNWNQNVMNLYNEI